MADVDDTASAGSGSAAVNPCHEQESMTGDKIVLKEFILNLESMPEVWNSAHINYKNTILKNEALKKLLTIFTRIKSDATIDDIKKKINSLRSNYRKELKKIVDSKRSGAGSGDVYQPKSWVFHLLHFLNKTEQPVAPSAPVSTVVSQVEQSQEGDTEEQSSGAFSSLNVPTPPKPKKKKGPIAKQNELLDKACYLLSQNVDQASQNTSSINPTALYWSSKLEKMHPIQRFYAERFINDILLEAELGNLTRNSVHINTFVRDDITTPSPAHSPYVFNPPTPSPISNSLISAPTPSPSSQSTPQGNTTMAPIYVVNPSTSTNSSASGTTGFTSRFLMQQSVNPNLLQRQEQMKYQKFHENNVNVSDQQLDANNNIAENAFHQADYNDVQEGRQPFHQNATISSLFSSFTDF